MKCVTVCYKGNLCEVIVSDGVIYKEGFCALHGEVVEALSCSEAVLCWMLNGSVLQRDGNLDGMWRLQTCRYDVM